MSHSAAAESLSSSMHAARIEGLDDRHSHAAGDVARDVVCLHNPRGVQLRVARRCECDDVIVKILDKCDAEQPKGAWACVGAPPMEVQFRKAERLVAGERVGRLT